MTLWQIIQAAILPPAILTEPRPSVDPKVALKAWMAELEERIEAGDDRGTGEAYRGVFAARTNQLAQELGAFAPVALIPTEGLSGSAAERVAS